MMNAVSVGAGESLETVLDVRQVAAKDKRVPLAQETAWSSMHLLAIGYTGRVYQLPTPLYSLPAHRNESESVSPMAVEGLCGRFGNL